MAKLTRKEVRDILIAKGKIPTQASNIVSKWKREGVFTEKDGEYIITEKKLEKLISKLRFNEPGNKKEDVEIQPVEVSTNSNHNQDELEELDEDDKLEEIEDDLNDDNTIDEYFELQEKLQNWSNKVELKVEIKIAKDKLFALELIQLKTGKPLKNILGTLISASLDDISIKISQ